MLLFTARIIPFYLIALVASTGTCSKSPKHTTDKSSISTFESKLESLRLKYKIPGFSAGVIRNGKVEWTKGFGFADVEKKIPVTNSTAFHLASLTKTFASTVIIQLVTEGK